MWNTCYCHRLPSASGLLLAGALICLSQSALSEGPENGTATSPVPVSREEREDPVTLYSDHVLRAQLTSRLEDKAPTERLGSRIRMNEKGLLRVYLFTELKGLKNQSVYYDWYLDSERRARVTVRPHLEQMRASVSKFIDQNMLGQWEVKVVLSDDTLLSRVRFEVLPFEDKKNSNKNGAAQKGDMEKIPERDTL